MSSILSPRFTVTRISIGRLRSASHCRSPSPGVYAPCPSLCRHAGTLLVRSQRELLPFWQPPDQHHTCGTEIPPPNPATTPAATPPAPAGPGSLPPDIRTPSGISSPNPARRCHTQPPRQLCLYGRTSLADKTLLLPAKPLTIPPSH